MKKRAIVAFALCLSLFAPAAYAQQTGSLSGRRPDAELDALRSDGCPEWVLVVTCGHAVTLFDFACDC